MQPRFCQQCGAKAPVEGRFCPACGAPLGGGAAPGARNGWRLTGTGAGVLGGLIIAGLAIWAVILSPSPPIPRPGETAARGPARPQPSAPGAAAPAMPPDHPETMEIPDEAKKFIAELEAKAKERPEDAEAWRRVALVTARAAQIDPAYQDRALAAFTHALEIAPKDADVLRGAANLRYDRNEHREAIALFERYLALRPDDSSARTDLGTMYFHAGDADRAIAIYREVLAKDPSFLQAHYNLAITYHRKGEDAAALAALEKARELAKEDAVRAQIDQAIASVKAGGGAPAGGSPPAGQPAASPPASTADTPFQRQVEEAFRGHPIMGPKIVRFEWTSPAAGRVMLQNFPMAAMPPEVREKFTTRLTETLRSAAASNGLSGPARVELADVSSGAVMATVTR
jgi:cytochrome c-type biogenesis protein CcmH/NrfG